MPKKKKVVFTSTEEAEVRRISGDVLKVYLRSFKMGYDAATSPARLGGDQHNNYVVISKSFQGSNAEQMELDINDWLKSTGAQEIHKIDSIKDPLSSMGVIKTVFVKVKQGTTETAKSDNATDTPEGN